MCGEFTHPEDEVWGILCGGTREGLFSSPRLQASLGETITTTVHWGNGKQSEPEKK